jgi:HlyD family secretion protein
MSSPALQTSAAPAHSEPPLPVPLRRRRRPVRLLIVCLVLALVAGGAVWGGYRLFRSMAASSGAALPTTSVKRGDVSLTVTAKAELSGGNSEEITAPMTGAGDMHISFLRKPGELVNEGDVILELDTTDQTYKLREAEADLSEAEQQVIKAQADGDAQLEENNYSLLKAQADIRQAELDCRKNPMLSAIVAKQNDLALESAKDRLAQLERDLANYKATGEAGIAIQEAARKKAESQAATARKNIDAMTVKAKRSGYVSIRSNTNSNMFYQGMVFPPFRVGDSVNPGMVIAEIPDLQSWELKANVGEQDQGHLAVAEGVDIQVVAVPFRKFHGHVKDLGGTMGPPWDRHFECKITLDDPSPELRPGMNATVVVSAEVLRNVLWVPGQAVFEADGRTFVYVKSGTGFAPADVKLVRRGESQAVITGVPEGQIVALANPDQQTDKKAGPGGALQALPK